MGDGTGREGIERQRKMEIVRYKDGERMRDGRGREGIERQIKIDNE